jgi:predicted NUDIX family NTP pyrophosphohydrolase
MVTLLFYEEIKKSINRAGLLVYKIENNQIEFLLMKPSDPNYGGSNFQIAKGQVDPGHDFYSTAFKEAEEELGVTKNNLTDVELLSHEKFKNGNQIQWYMGRIIDFNKLIPFHYETGEIAWFKPGDIGKIRIDHRSVVYKALRSITKNLTRVGTS